MTCPSRLSLAVAIFLSLSVFRAGGQAWQPDEFPISYWYSPPDAFLDAERIAEIAGMDFTVMGNLSVPTVQRAREVLDLAGTHGLRVLVMDRRLRLFLSDQDGWETTVDAVVADYADHPAFYGYFLKDEPNRAQFPLLAKLEDALSGRDPAHLPYINLFPTYATPEQLGTPSYYDHLEEYLTTVTPRVVSYDHYALLKNDKLRPDYFENLELVRDAAQRHGVPFWFIIQLIQASSSWREVTEQDLRWQVYTSLAYGVKGIWYFTMWTVPSWNKEDPAVVGIYDLQGKRTRFFEPVKRVNAELRVIGQAMLGLRSVGVFHTPSVPEGGRRPGGTCPVVDSDGGDLLIGWFRDPGSRDYIMVVNKDHRHECRARLTLRERFRSAFETSCVTGTEKAVAFGGIVPPVLTADLRPGAGRLFRLERGRPHGPQPSLLEAAAPSGSGRPKQWGTDQDGLTLAAEYHTGDVPPGGRRLGSASPAASVTGDPLVVRWLKDDGRQDFLSVANPDPLTAATARLTIRGPLTGVYEVDTPGDTGRPAPLDAGPPAALSVDLAPASGRLYRVDRGIPWASLPPVLTRFPITFHNHDDTQVWRGAHSVSDVRLTGGRLTMLVTGPDPYLIRRRLHVPAESCPVLVIRMSKQAGGKGQIFWTTSDSPAFADDKHITYETPADGQFHDIRLPVGKHPMWAGKTITALRIDPDVVGEPGTVAVESIRAETTTRRSSAGTGAQPAPRR